MRLRPCRRRRPWWPALLAGATSLLTATILLTLQPEPATAVVTHELGYRATVLGFTSWYGSYGMGSLGRGWCIDHGSHSPDPDYGYVPTSLVGATPRTRTALAWVAARWGATTDRDTTAAVMLVLHDLMAARYPGGRLVVEDLTPARLAGFGGHEAAILDRARRIKADAVAHAGWLGPLRLHATIDPAPAPVLRVSVSDAAGHGLQGIAVQLHAPAAWHLPASMTTGPVGTAARPLPAAALGVVDLRATVPDLRPDVSRSSSHPAQRVIRPAVTTVTARATLAPPPTTTTAPTTTTTVPPTTTTTAAPTTTTLPPTTTTTVAPTAAIVTTTTVAPASTTSTSSPPVTAVVPPSTAAPATSAPLTTAPVTAAPALPRTGSEPLGLALSGLGLGLLGLALVDLTPGPVDQDGRRGAARRRA